MAKLETAADSLSGDGRHLTRLSSLIGPTVLGSLREGPEMPLWDLAGRVTGKLVAPVAVGCGTDRAALSQRGKHLGRSWVNC